MGVKGLSVPPTDSCTWHLNHSITSVQTVHKIGPLLADNVSPPTQASPLTLIAKWLDRQPPSGLYYHAAFSHSSGDLAAQLMVARGYE
jgi:hypothetical protein